MRDRDRHEIMMMMMRGGEHGLVCLFVLFKDFKFYGLRPRFQKCVEKVQMVTKKIPRERDAVKRKYQIRDDER